MWRCNIFNVTWPHKNMWLKDHMMLKVGAPPCMSPTCQVFGHRHCSNRDINLSHGLARPRDLWNIGLYGKGSLKVRQHLAQFSGHRHHDSKDILVLICHMILQQHTIKSPCKFMDRSPSRYVTISPSLVAISNMVVKIQ